MRKKIDFMEVLMWFAGILIVVLLGWGCYFGINACINITPNTFYPQKIDSKEIILFNVFIIAIFLLSGSAIISLVNNKIKERRIRIIQIKHADTEFNELKNVCKKIGNENKKIINKYKKKYVTKYIINIIMFLILILSFIFHFFYEYKTWIYDNIIIFCLVFWGTIIFFTNRENYNEIIKDNYICKFIELLNPKMKYYKDIYEYVIKTSYKGDKQKEIERVYSEFKNNNVNLLIAPSEEFEIYDYIEGINKKNDYMQIMKVHFYIRVRTGRSYIFKGNIAIIDKNTNKYIKIFSNKIKDLDMETPNSSYDFEKYFSIIVRDNENQENYISSDLKNFLLDFRNKYKLEFDIVLKDKIYIRFYTKNMFEPKVFGSPIDETSIYQYYAITKFAEELIEKINI